MDILLRLIYPLAAALLAAAIVILPAAVQAQGVEGQRVVLRVGPGPTRDFARPGGAAQVAQDGDVIEIDAGVYEGEAVVWTQNRLTIRGVGGRAHMRANGTHAEGKAIWVIKGANTTIEGVEFSGAAVTHRNGAGIRLEGPGLILRNCYFHDNENGILAGDHPQSDILIERSEFARNGHGDGYSHNIYIGTVRRFTLRYSYVHHAIVGHNVKSRALRNHVIYNRIVDENDGRSSYTIDLPNGGLSFLIGNVLQQGPATENTTLVSYGAEGLTHPVNELYVAGNTLVNDLPAGGRFLFVQAGTASALVVNNLFLGPGELVGGTAEQRNNSRAAASDFVDPEKFDYRLRAGSPAIGRGIDAGAAHGVELRPSQEYVHKARSRQRSRTGMLDLGALEFRR